MGGSDLVVAGLFFAFAAAARRELEGRGACCLPLGPQKSSNGLRSGKRINRLVSPGIESDSLPTIMTTTLWSGGGAAAR